MRVVRNTAAPRRCAARLRVPEHTFAVHPDLHTLWNTRAAARLFKEFAKANAKFGGQSCSLEGERSRRLRTHAPGNLPTYEVKLHAFDGKLAKEASAGKLVRTLVAVMRQKEVA